MPAITIPGFVTGINSKALIKASLEQEQLPIDRMNGKLKLNSKRATLISSMRSALQSLNASIKDLGKSFNLRTVTSSDPNNTFVTATASGAATGTYDVIVSQIASRARLTSSNPVSSAAANLGGTLNPSTNTYNYVITNTDGKQTTVSLDAAHNTLTGLRDAINANSSTSGVNATIVQSTIGNFNLVVSANNTGLGASTSADPANIYIKGNTNNALGFSDSGSGTVSSVSAQNAKFSINGLSMERASNVVTDAVDGMTFTLKAFDSTKTTTISVSLDQKGITAAMNEVVNKYNAFYKIYKDNAFTRAEREKDKSGPIPTDPNANNSSSIDPTQKKMLGEDGVLAGDTTVRNLIYQAQSAFMSIPTGLSTSNAFQSLASLGLKTNRDGTMSLDTATFQNAINTDVVSASNLVSAVGTSFQTFVNKAAGFSNGGVASILKDIDSQNQQLRRQISNAVTRMDKHKAMLENQYANMEATVGQLNGVLSSLGNLNIMNNNRR